jgi:transposase
VPPPPVRELRALVQHRQRLVWQRSTAKNRLRALLNRHQIAAPAGDLFAPAHRDWWADLTLNPVEAVLCQPNLTSIDVLSALIQEAEVLLARLSVQPPWREQVAFLIQLPGISLRNAMTILGAIDDIRRFPRAKSLVGYAGLGTRVHDTGDRRQHGGITKQGRRELRTALVEAAWVAVR